MPRLVWYLLPILPLGMHLSVIAWHWKYMARVLSNSERDSEAHRALLLGMAGFSFAGLLALIVLQGALLQDLQLAVYSLLLSFLGYLVAMNLQAYKFYRWVDQLGDGLRDTASLSLVLAIVHTIRSSELDAGFAALASTLALTGWTVDFLVRYGIDVSFVRKERSTHEEDRADAKGAEGTRAEED